MKIDIRYLIVLLLAFLFMELVGGYSGNTLFLLVLLLLAAAAIQVLLFSFNLRVELQEPQGRLLAGEPVRLAINLDNRSMLSAPYVSSLAAQISDRRVISVAARDKANLTYDFLPKVRGIIDVGEIQLGVTDVLNILTRVRKLQPGEIKVYPNVRELRRYKPGDSFRKINWKVSAKFNDLFVRRGETTEEKDVLIILDMFQGILAMDEAGLYENALVTDALALSRGLLDQGIGHGFLMNDARGQFHPVLSQDAYVHLEEDLILHKADGRETLREFIARKNEFLHDRGTLIFFTRPIEADIAACERLKYDRNEVVVFAPRLAHSEVSKDGRRVILKELEGPGYEMA